MTHTPDKYCVFGNPIAHTKSPQIHSAFAKETNQNIVYNKQLVELGEFAKAARDFFDHGGKGLNITVPFKHDAFDFADLLTERADTAGAVNTLVLQENGKIMGDNTDGIGMVSDITQRLKWAIHNKRILILGAGGAVKGVLLPVLHENPAEVVIANRTVSKAEDLAKRFAQYGNISAVGFDGIGGRAFDIIINGTSASLAGDLPPIPDTCIVVNGNVYDMMYAKEATPFITWAKQNGAANTADGLGMLVGQAAEAFNLWRGVRPNTQDIFEILRSHS